MTGILSAFESNDENLSIRFFCALILSKMAQNLIVFISDRFNIILGVRIFMMAGVP